MDRPVICVPTEFGEKKSSVPVPPTTLRVILTGTPTLKDGSTAGRIVSATAPPPPTFTATSFDGGPTLLPLPAFTRTK